MSTTTPTETVKASAVVEMIDPTIAHNLLSNHPRNRRLSRLRVEGLTKAMEEGAWVFDGQPIRIDIHGSLVDGQHRLNALIAANMTLPFLVLRGVPTEAMATMDTGKSRSFSDILTIEDPSLVDTLNLAATTRILYLWEHGVRGRPLSSAGSRENQSVGATANELLLYFRAHSEEIIATTREAQKYKRGIGGANLSALSLAVWTLGGLDTEDSTFFFERLVDGVGLDAGSPILALRKRLNESAVERERLATYEAVALIFKAWNFFREGKDMQLLAWKQGGAHPESFPEPK